MNDLCEEIRINYETSWDQPPKWDIINNTCRNKKNLYFAMNFHFPFSKLVPTCYNILQNGPGLSVYYSSSSSSSLLTSVSNVSRMPSTAKSLLSTS